MTTFHVITENSANEVRTTDTCVRLQLAKGTHLTIEHKALISHTEGAVLEPCPEDSFTDMLSRTISGDARKVRRVSVTGDQGAVVELGAGTVEPQAAMALEVDGVNGMGFTVSDGAWIAHTDGVDMTSVWKGWEGAFARERMSMAHFAGQGLLLVEGSGTLVKREVADGETFTLGQARLVAYSDGIELNSENVAGRRLMNIQGPGIVVYKTHAENI